MGQDQDKVGGGFSAAQSFTGEITGISVWDHVKSAADISKFAKSCSAGKGNVVSMANLGKKKIRAGVQMIPSTCKPH